MTQTIVSLVVDYMDTRVDQFSFFENFKLPHVACAQGGVKITCSNLEFV